jgi:hypothetical protein
LWFGALRLITSECSRQSRWQASLPSVLLSVMVMVMGSPKYLKLLKNILKTPLFWPYIELFRGKKSIIDNNQWRELKDIIFLGRYGTSPTDAIKESFCSSLQRIGEDGFSGFLKQRSVMACRY